MKFFMVVTAILNSEKLLPFLHYLTNAHQIWWECCESYMERTVSSRNANSKVKLAAAAILNFEKHLRFLCYSTYSHQTCWGCCKFNVEYATATVESVMSTRFKLKVGGCRHIEYRKDVANSLLLNRFSPNMLLISYGGLLVEKRQILMLKTV